MSNNVTPAGDYAATTEFISATIIIPVMDETVSLTQTVETIIAETPLGWIRELLIVVGNNTTKESMAVVAELKLKHHRLIVVHHQRLPFLGGAMREAFDLARGSHTLMMSSDLETDPKDVRWLIEEARRNPSSIVTTSRWIRRDEFHGYSKIKLVCNWMFQKMFSVLYGTKLTDLTFGFRILPTKLIQAIRWEELRHPFMFETLVKPLRLGVPVTEIPTSWRARIEGKSQNPFFRNFAYFRTGFCTRFATRRSLLKSNLNNES